MTVSTQPNRRLSQFWICCCSTAAVFLFGSADRVLVQAQGLSGPPQRLEETLGSSPGGPQTGGGGSTAPAGYGAGSSGPPAGNGGSSSGGPPAGYGAGSSGPPAGYGAGSSGPPAGYGAGSSGPPAGYGAGSSGPPAGYGAGSSGPPSGYGDDMNMDMNMEDMYGGGGGPGGGRSRTPGAPSSDAMKAYAWSLTSLARSLDLSPMFGPTEDVTVEAGPVLNHEAEQAFKSGNMGLARELMFGHMAAEYDDARVALQTVKYSRLLRRPVWNIRFGISIAVRGDASEDPKPIREGANSGRMQMAANDGPGGGYGGDGGYGAEMMDQGMDDDMEQQMEMEMEMEMEMAMEMGGGPGGASGRGGPSARRASAPKVPARNMLDPQANERLDKTLGLVATVAAEQFAKRFQAGDYGQMLTSISAPPPVAANRRGGAPSAPAMQSFMSEGLNEILSDAAEPLPMWQPGIVYLGEGTAEENIPVARAANLDLLLHFDVHLKSNRTGVTQNNSRLRLLNVATGKSIGVSKAMDNWEAAQLAGTGRMGERAYVEERLGYLFAILDRQVKSETLPKLSADIARRRIASLMASKEARTLRTLAEIRLYQMQDLISESDVEAAFDIIGSVDALMLLHGPRNERIEMAHQWAIESQPEIER